MFAGVWGQSQDGKSTVCIILIHIIIHYTWVWLTDVKHNLTYCSETLNLMNNIFRNKTDKRKAERQKHATYGEKKKQFRAHNTRYSEMCSLLADVFFFILTTDLASRNWDKAVVFPSYLVSIGHLFVTWRKKNGSRKCLFFMALKIFIHSSISIETRCLTAARWSKISMSPSSLK